MAKAFPVRYTAQADDDFVLFLVGMRVNKPWKVNRWWPVASAMPKMLRTLGQHPELGCLGYQSWFGRTTLLAQYWRDFESLDRFARDKELPHHSGDVGIWHETYRVNAGAYEAVYGKCPCSDWRPRRPTFPSGERPTRRQLGSEPAGPTSLLSSRIEAHRLRASDLTMSGSGASDLDLAVAWPVPEDQEDRSGTLRICAVSGLPAVVLTGLGTGW